MKSNPINSTITTSKNVEKILPMAFSQNMYEENGRGFSFSKDIPPTYLCNNPIYIFFATRSLRYKELSTEKRK